MDGHRSTYLWSWDRPTASRNSWYLAGSKARLTLSMNWSASSVLSSRRWSVPDAVAGATAGRLIPRKQTNKSDGKSLDQNQITMSEKNWRRPAGHQPSTCDEATHMLRGGDEVTRTRFMLFVAS